MFQVGTNLFNPSNAEVTFVQSTRMDREIFDRQFPENLPLGQTHISMKNLQF